MLLCVGCATDPGGPLAGPAGSGSGKEEAGPGADDAGATGMGGPDATTGPAGDGEPSSGDGAGAASEATGPGSPEASALGRETGGGPSSEASVDCVPGTGTQDIDAMTARDDRTCLVWQKTPTCAGDWRTVAACCAGLVQGGFDDWRMPTVAELLTWVKPATNAEYVTCPAYVKPGAGDPANNFEYCTVTTYSAVTCAHRGQATTSPTYCVRGRGRNVPSVVTATACSPACGTADESVFLACTPPP